MLILSVKDNKAKIQINAENQEAANILMKIFKNLMKL